METLSSLNKTQREGWWVCVYVFISATFSEQLFKKKYFKKVRTLRKYSLESILPRSCLHTTLKSTPMSVSLWHLSAHFNHNVHLTDQLIWFQSWTWLLWYEWNAPSQSHDGNTMVAAEAAVDSCVHGQTKSGGKRAWNEWPICHSCGEISHLTLPPEKGFPYTTLGWRHANECVCGRETGLQHVTYLWICVN